MRLLLRLLVLLCVMAPVGKVGITATPGEAETQIITPRGDRCLAARSEIALDVAVAAVACAASPPRPGAGRVATSWPPRLVHEHRIERTIGARAPPT